METDGGAGYVGYQSDYAYDYASQFPMFGGNLGMLSNLEDSQYDDDNNDEVRESLVTKSGVMNMIQQIINDAKTMKFPRMPVRLLRDTNTSSSVVL